MEGILYYSDSNVPFCFSVTFSVKKLLRYLKFCSCSIFTSPISSPHHKKHSIISSLKHSSTESSKLHFFFSSFFFKYLIILKQFSPLLSAGRNCTRKAKKTKKMIIRKTIHFLIFVKTCGSLEEIETLMFLYVIKFKKKMFLK